MKKSAKLFCYQRITQNILNLVSFNANRKAGSYSVCQGPVQELKTKIFPRCFHQEWIVYYHSFCYALR